eukprot:TRINITY_DN182_c0_g1_i2.p1 TRINITY_DN182_c0_g1~~TRINITY_DN182_c0_g1_i2.p1  ORF type:complete len:162 (+),score=48.60 TRINITY_DN182_c0_g1_i2:480-965(+)
MERLINFDDEMVWDRMNRDMDTPPRQHRIVVNENMSPSDGYNSESPTTSEKKKKKYRYGPRDSLNKRYHVGSPGSRRYRQWENEFFLIKNLSETESSFSELGVDEDWKSENEPSFGAFAAVFEPGNKELWEPFIDTTEAKQSEDFMVFDIALDNHNAWEGK